MRNSDDRVVVDKMSRWMWTMLKGEGWKRVSRSVEVEGVKFEGVKFEGVEFEGVEAEGVEIEDVEVCKRKKK